jgi:hypothetical protein
MFKGFDYGKSLMRQVDAYRRMTLLQQGKRHPVLVKALEAYIKKFMQVLESPGSANPGQLKNGAEVMVESAIALQETDTTFAAFADMASRSRKVPVVPGLAGLVDRLLESPDEQKQYRVGLYNWRITAGSLRPERKLKYLSERAHLTQTVDHWREYAYGLLQLLDKKNIERTDKLALSTLDDLLANIKMLGDQGVPIHYLCIEVMLETNRSRQAEELLFELVREATDPHRLPRQFFNLAGELLIKRPDAGWELHQLMLDATIADYAAGKHGFSAVEKLIQREKGKSAELLNYLLNHEALVKDKRLSVVAMSKILGSPNMKRDPYIKRWYEAYENVRVEPPAEVVAMIESAAQDQPADVDALLQAMSDEPVPELALPAVGTEELVFPPVLTASEPEEELDEATSAASEEDLLGGTLVIEPAATAGDELAAEVAEDEEALELEDEAGAEEDEYESIEEASLAEEPANAEAADEEVEAVAEQPAAAAALEHDAGAELEAEVEVVTEAEAEEAVAAPVAEAEPEPAAPAAEDEDPELAAILAEISAEPEAASAEDAGVADEPVEAEPAAEAVAYAEPSIEPEAAGEAVQETAAGEVEPAAEAAVEPTPEPAPEHATEPAAEAAPEPEAEPEAAAIAVEPEPEPEPLPVPPPLPALAALLDAPQIWRALDTWVSAGELIDTLPVLEHALAEDNLPPLVLLEARLWLIERQLAHSMQEQAGAQLRLLQCPDGTDPAKLLDRINMLLGDEPPAAALPLISTLARYAGNFNRAYTAAASLPPADPARMPLLVALDEWIVSQPEPSPALLMVLAKTQRDLRDDPQAGFTPATTANLLSAGDPQLQGDYAGWVIALAPEVVHRERAQQATFLTAREGRNELLPVALNEIEALAGVLPVPPPRELLEWLDELRAIVDEAAPGQAQQELLLRWTRIYLQLAAQIGEQERLQQVLSTATQLIAPDAAYLLVTELGHNLPFATRLRIECSALVRQGQWEQALELALDPASTQPEAVPLDTFCTELPDEALVPAGARLVQFYSNHGDTAGQLHVIQQLHARFGDGGVKLREADALRIFLDQQLEALCEQVYAPAVRYRLELTGADDIQARARDLLALLSLGEPEAEQSLADLYPQLLDTGEPVGLILEVAGELAAREAGRQPDAAVKLIAGAGLSLARADWALQTLEQLRLSAVSPEALELTGQLAFKLGDAGRALGVAEHLINLRSPQQAQRLIDLVLKVDSENPHALALEIRALLIPESRDLPRATGLLLKLAQQYQHSGLDTAELLAPLGHQIDNALQDAPDSHPVRYLRLAFAALTGDQKQAAFLVQQIMQSGEGASADLLSLFEQLALEDAELPAPLVIAWGQALFDAGRLSDALARLAGLRDAVGNYPEYIALLEEIKEHGGGPGASMQLGEAYLRVHLWQRSAEEYAAALAEDPALAEPILTQLRHHAALDPNPMKYPLHVLGLRAVACSVRTADWGWALSALAWLKGRWSAEELYERGLELWESQGQVELEREHRQELLLNLQSLALSIGEPGQALDYLEQAWELADGPQPGLASALAEFDEQRLPDAPETKYKLARLHFKAALATRKTEAILAAAAKLASFGEEGRAAALAGLADFREHASDPVAITIARLKLLDLQSQAGAQAFITEVRALALDKLPREQAFNLVQSAVELVQTLPGNAELATLLLELFTQLGDFARVWQLGLNLFLDPALGQLALQALEATAADEFAVQQQVALVEVHRRRQDYAAVGKALTRLGWGNIAVFGPQAEALAEALLDTPAASDARRWLITWYREQHQDALAADHVVWAHAQGDQQPAGWLEEARTGDLLYRAALLRELANDLPAAKRVLERARKTGISDPAIEAGASTRLSELAESEGNLALACELAQDAARALPEETTLATRVAALERAQVEEKIAAARLREDTPERTLEIARLYRQLKDYAQAVNELQNSLGRGHSQPALFIELAECFNERGDLNLARRAFNEVLRRLEQVNDLEASLRARYGLAVTEERLGSPEEAIRNLEQILVLRQNYRNSREWLNRLYGKVSAPPPDAKAKHNILSEIFTLLGQPHDDPGQPKKE